MLAEATKIARPYILAVDDDPEVLAAVKRDLQQQYSAKYRILGLSSGEQAIETLETLKQRGDDVALVLSDQRMPGMLGVDLLRRVINIYPEAYRMLLTAYSDPEEMRRAINDARVHYYVQKPWDPPAEKLYPNIDDGLYSYEERHRPEKLLNATLVGNRFDARTYALRNYFAANRFEYAYLEPELPAAQKLMQEYNVPLECLPSLFLPEGKVLQNPTPLEVSEELHLPGLEIKYDTYDVAIIGAGLAAAQDRSVGDVLRLQISSNAAV